MESRAGAGLRELGVRVCFRAAPAGFVWLTLFLAAAPVRAQAGKEGAAGQAEEHFERVDPYTKGDPERMRRAGYVTFEPTTWAEGISCAQMAEALGGVELLWVETAHFKICSSLKSYKNKGDAEETAQQEKEFARLAQRLPGFKAPRAGKLDPWLRLHLYAQRLEELYAEFCARTGFAESDFPPVGTQNAMGRGPYLGMPLKPTVLIAEKRSTVGRFNRRFADVDRDVSQRSMLPGGTIFLGISAEELRDNGYELDTALHCAVVACVAGNLLDGLRDSYWSVPMWFEVGLGHWFSRRIDERFTYYASSATRSIDDPSTRWQPRVRGLVDNDFPYSWRDMLGTLVWASLTPQSHMLIWSRVDWMLQCKDANLRAFLEPLSVRLPQGTPEAIAAVQLQRATEALAKGFGRTPEQCDAAWQAWVLKKYAKK